MTTRRVPDRFQVAFSFAGEQRDFVRAIAMAVEKELGQPNVFLDEWFEHYIAGDDADLRLQEVYEERSELVVVCISKPYGEKAWTRTEHKAIRSRIMQAPQNDLGVLPIRVGEGEVEGIRFNTIAPDCRERSAADVAKLIIGRLYLVAPEVAGQVPGERDWPEQPAPLNWPVADHTEVRDAFELLLSRTAPWRLLPVSGPSESGKSFITRHMLGNALAIRELRCGRFDFKGTTDMDGELRTFVQHLDVPFPSGSRLNERLSQILDAIRRQAQPALLIFDTYEAAGEAEQWVERQLLSTLIRADWLRVVIAGQRVPKTTGSIWAESSSPVITLKSPPVSDWYEYGRHHRPDLTLHDVETVYRLAPEKPSLLAQILGPES